MEHGERIRLNDRLIRLEGTAELPFALAELIWQDGGMTTTGVLKAVGVR